MSEDRLARIEVQLEKLTDVVVKLARLDERQLDMADGIKRIWKKEEELDKRLQALESKIAATSWIERVVWVIVIAGVAAQLT